MKRIKTCTGKIALVDNEDFAKVKDYHWHDNGKHVYRYQGKRRVWLHLQILGTTPHTMPENQIADHKNGNGFDCQKQNLRFISPLQNTWNRKKMRGGSSKFKGVSLNKSTQRWRARITIHGKEKSLGYFKTEREAALAYNEQAKIHFGEFARLNEVKNECA